MASTRSQPKAEHLSLADQAYYTIRERILKGEIALGAPLSRRKLAVEFGMSLLPVSEAFQALEADGLVESRPRVGTRVCFPTAEEIRQHYEVREGLESQAARLYAKRATQQQRRAMEKMAARMDALFNQSFAADRQDREFLYAVHSYHLQFHLKIAEGGHCDILRQMIERNHVLIFNWLFDVAASRPPLPPRFHCDLADRAMRKHVRHGLEPIVKALGTRQKSARFERVK